VNLWVFVVCETALSSSLSGIISREEASAFDMAYGKCGTGVYTSFRCDNEVEVQEPKELTFQGIVHVIANAVCASSR